MKHNVESGQAFGFCYFVLAVLAMFYGDSVAMWALYILAVINWRT